MKALLAVVVVFSLAGCVSDRGTFEGSAEQFELGDGTVFYLRDFEGTATLRATAPFDHVELHVTLDDAEIRILDAADAVVTDWTRVSTLLEDERPAAYEGVVALAGDAAAVQIRAQTTVRFARIVTGRESTTAHESDAGTDGGATVMAARAGRWVPPASVLSAANQQYLPYSGAPSSCSGSLKVGTRKLGDFLKASFAGATSYGGYACRANTANTSQLSVHASGRAIDLFVPLDAGAADNDKGDPIANYLIENAQAIGIEFLVWDRTSWGAYRAAPKHQQYTGPHPHHDHLHIELSPSRAALSSPTFPPVGGTPVCACTPGNVQNEACGKCGTRTRTCASSCQWGGWGDCDGQGPCSPGAAQTRDCGDCGTQTRTCRASCEWGGYDACDGPDPEGGNQACDTGELGPCSEGRDRCRAGNLSCVGIVEPVDEVCDDIDNDCNGEADDGAPDVLGTTPPAFGGELLDASWPATLRAGEPVTVWADFRNVGSETWPAGGVWLQAGSAANDAASPLHDPDSWPAWDVAAVAWDAVPPGEIARVVFQIETPVEAAFSESFHLRAPSGDLIGCPRPSFEIAGAVTDGGLSLLAAPIRAPRPAPFEGGPELEPAPTSTSVHARGDACQHVRARPGGTTWWALVPFLALAFRRR